MPASAPQFLKLQKPRSPGGRQVAGLSRVPTLPKTGPVLGTRGPWSQAGNRPVSTPSGSQTRHTRRPLCAFTAPGRPTVCRARSEALGHKSEAHSSDPRKWKSGGMTEVKGHALEEQVTPVTLALLGGALRGKRPISQVGEQAQKQLVTCLRSRVNGRAGTQGTRCL